MWDKMREKGHVIHGPVPLIVTHIGSNGVKGPAKWLQLPHGKDAKDEEEGKFTMLEIPSCATSLWTSQIWSSS